MTVGTVSAGERLPKPKISWICWPKTASRPFLANKSRKFSASARQPKQSPESLNYDTIRGQGGCGVGGGGAGRTESFFEKIEKVNE